MLTVRFYKHHHKPVTLKCIRYDQSETWSSLHPNTEYHDLAHIAIEEVLGFKKAFYGMVANGVNISDFELPDVQKPEALRGSNLPQESIITEHLVNLLTITYFNASDIDPMDYITQAKNILTQHHLPFPDTLTPQNATTIYATYSELINDWNMTEKGTYLEKNIVL